MFHFEFEPRPYSGLGFPFFLLVGVFLAPYKLSDSEPSTLAATDSGFF